MKLKGLLMEAGETFTATNKKTGKTSVFKTKDSRDAAVKAGTHTAIKEPKGKSTPSKPGVNIFDKPASKGGPGSGRKPKADKPAEEPKKHNQIDTNSPETRTIQTYSNARPQAITDFVNKHKLDATALGNFLQKGSLSDRMDFITALVGEPGNKYEKKIIDKFAEKEEGGDKGGFQTPKRQGNPQVNKKVRQMANDLGITPNDYATSEYKKKMMQAAVEALTDANFHQEARELVAKLEGKPEWVKRPEYGTPEYDKWVKSGVYDSVYFNGDEDTRKLGIAASQESSWDGVEAIDSLAFTLRMAGFGKEADTIQSIFDNKSYMKKESMSLKKMMRK